MGLRLASREVKRIELSDDAWIEVTSDISKRDFLRIITSMPDTAIKQDDGSDKVTLSISEASDFQQILFEVLVQGWSLDVPVSLEAYLDLAREGADQVDAALVDHFKNVVSPQKDELGKPSTSPDKRRKG
jgi:hypothetical protein